MELKVKESKKRKLKEHDYTKKKFLDYVLFGSISLITRLVAPDPVKLTRLPLIS